MAKMTPNMTQTKTPKMPERLSASVAHGAIAKNVHGTSNTVKKMDRTCGSGGC